VRTLESLACLQFCSGSPAGWWWKPCSFRLPAQWRRFCFQWAPRCLAGVCCGLSSPVFLLPRPQKGFAWPIPRWTHPARVAVVALVITDLVSISKNAATWRATWRHLSSSWGWKYPIVELTQNSDQI